VAAAVLAGVGLPAPAYADTVRDEQYQLRTLDVGTAWRTATGDGVIVAVLDSGVDATHPDLEGQVLPGADFVDGSTDGRHDFVGHGTTVAGLIAGRNDKGSGVAGIAPKAKILPVRVLDAENRYNDATVVANGLRWAVDHGARVVNISLGGGARSDLLADALGYAAAHDVVIVACTGNVTAGATSTEVWYPARESGVVAVTGLTGSTEAGVPASTGGIAAGGGAGGAAAADPLWAGAITGRPTVLAAPAVNLIGARPGGHWRVQGTSFASPLVAATAALVRSRWPAMDAPNVVNRLIRTARDLGEPGRDDRYGYGEVDPVAALTATLPVVRRNPLLPADPAAVQRLSERVEPTPARRAAAPVAPLRAMLGVGAGMTVFAILLVLGLVAARRWYARRRA
jgi:type VII secretion-associated serine protease mycosin